MILQAGKQSCHRERPLLATSTIWVLQHGISHHRSAHLWQKRDRNLHATTLCLPHTLPAVFKTSICFLPSFHETATNERKELPPGVTVTLLQFPQQKRKRDKLSAVSLTDTDDILGMSPSVCFTASLHCSVPCGKQD